MMILAKKLRLAASSNKAWILLDQAVFSIVSFATTIILARQLGVQGFGVYSAITLFLFLALSLSGAVIIGPFLVLHAKEEDQKGYIDCLAFFQMILCLALGALTIPLISLCPGLSGLDHSIRGLTAFLLIGFLLHDGFRRIFLATAGGRQAFIMDLVSGVTQLAALALLSLRSGLTLPWSLFIVAVTYVPSVFYALAVLRPSLPSRDALRRTLGLHVRAGRWLLLTAFLQWWANNSLVAVSGLFLGMAALGALRLAQSIFGVLNALLQVLENYALPKAAVFLQESRPAMLRFLRRVTAQSFMLLLPFVLLVMLFPGRIFALCGGAAFASHASALRGMAALYCIIFAGYPVRIAMRALLLNRDFFIAYCLSFGFSLLFAKYFITHWQLGGAIAALVVNQLLMLGYWQIVLARKKIFLWR